MPSIPPFSISSVLIQIIYVFCMLFVQVFMSSKGYGCILVKPQYHSICVFVQYQNIEGCKNKPPDN